jgi:hypothetical protein
MDPETYHEMDPDIDLETDLEMDPKLIWKRIWKLIWKQYPEPNTLMEPDLNSDPYIWNWFQNWIPNWIFLWQSTEFTPRIAKIGITH